MEIITDPVDANYQVPALRLKNNIIPWIKNHYPKAWSEINKLEKSNRLKSKIIILIDKTPINNPKANTRIAEVDCTGQIYINEGYLAFLWLISYSLLITWKELIHKPLLDGSYGYNLFELKPSVKPFLQYGLNHFLFARTFLVNDINWDERIYSSPIGSPLDIENQYWGEANAVFLSAVTFILLHEIGHIKHDHFRKRYEYFSKNKTNWLKKLENNSDRYASRICELKNPNSDISLTKAFGSIVAVCSDLFLDRYVYRDEHESADKRIIDRIDSITDDKNSEFYSIGLIAIRLWDLQYQVGINWNEDINSTYEQFLREIVI